jgi:PKD repeat protein
MPITGRRLRMLVRGGTDRSRGQSIVELALIVPVLLLIVMVAIDFGRVYLGWVNLQNMTRIAAAFAANNPDAWETPGDAGARARYAELVENDAKAINCDLDGGVRDPIFANGNELGDLVDVGFSCQFAILTPIISNVLGGEVLVSASASYPVRRGFVAGVPGGGGGPIVAAPDTDFVASPRSGYAPLTVQFTDTSLNAPTSWTWTFEGAGTSLDRDPVKIWDTPGVYTVTLTAQNSGGSDTITKSSYIEVLAPPTTGPIPAFDADPRVGNDPLAVDFEDQSTGGAVTWSWAFGDGGTSAAQNPGHTYATPGQFDVTLTVSDGTTQNTLTKVAFILVDALPCRVPNFINTRWNNAQNTWEDAGFTTQVQRSGGNGNFLIRSQSLAGTTIPPAGCGATIVLGP